jgi:exonuclease VII large subunit
MEMDPITTIPTPPAVIAAKLVMPAPAEKPAAVDKAAVATVTPLGQSLASIDVQTQKKRDDGRRRILEDELSKEEQSLDESRSALTKEQANPQLVAAVRAAQQAENPTPAQMVAFREDIDKASGRIRGLQSTVAEHEKNVEALKKELGGLKP